MFDIFIRSNSEQPNESILVFGDVGGCVNALIFCESTISLFDRPAQASASQQGQFLRTVHSVLNTIYFIDVSFLDITLMVDLGDIAKGHYKNCRYAYHSGHTEWTRQGLNFCSFLFKRVLLNTVFVKTPHLQFIPFRVD